MPSVPAHHYRQSGVIPLRKKGGRRHVLLITSRRRKRWVIPKGIVEPEMTPAASAAKEAWEEAGLRGRLSKSRLGRYRYEKWGGTCTVDVYVMKVDAIAKSWPEAERTRRWVPLDEAARLVEEPGLRRLLRRLREKVEG